MEPIPVLKSAEPIPAGMNNTPAALPVTVTEEQAEWLSKPDRQQPGEWGPSRGKKSPSTAPRGEQSRTTQQGSDVVRAQAEELRPDPTAALIRQICAGRATPPAIQWTGSARLRVTFSCTSASAAQRLLHDISARPELRSLQIDFSVAVR